MHRTLLGRGKEGTGLHGKLSTNDDDTITYPSSAYKKSQLSSSASFSPSPLPSPTPSSPLSSPSSSPSTSPFSSSSHSPDADTYPDLKEGDTIEMCPLALATVEDIAKRVVASGGM